MGVNIVGKSRSNLPNFLRDVYILISYISNLRSSWCTLHILSGVIGIIFKFSKEKVKGSGHGETTAELRAVSRSNCTRPKVTKL